MSMDSAAGALDLWVPAMSGVAGVVVGSVVSYFIAKAQIRAQVVASSRVSWIGSIRDTVSEFLSLVSEVVIDERRGAVLAETALSARLTRMLRLLSDISLLINEQDKVHQALALRMQEAWTSATQVMAKKETDFGKAQGAVLSAAHAVLREEWSRIGRLR